MITEFRGEFRFLSNFWPSEVVAGNKIWPTVEHAYQAMKTVNPMERNAILALDTPGKAKRFGRTVTLRSEWEVGDFKLLEMFGLVQQKFFMHEDLRAMLLATGDEVIQEGNQWGDTFWGVCNGVGQNKLGKILMNVRERSKLL